MPNGAKVGTRIRWGTDVGDEGPEHGLAASSPRPVLRVGLVNIMPAAGFAYAHRAFTRLLVAGATEVDLELHCYRVPAVSPSPVVLDSIPCVYRSFEELYGDPPDALVVTGTEPTTSDITAEPYWSTLAELILWAEATVPSTLLSCLAAHGALRVLDQVDRVSLPLKRSGVFAQEVNQSHPLGRGLSEVATFPHSRCNEVPGSVVRSLGYDMVVGCAGEDRGEDWTVAARQHAGNVLVLMQGHPEYTPTTLLREYRRDMQKFAEGSLSTPPRIPVQYLDRTGEELLGAWTTWVKRQPPSEWCHSFPFDAVADHIVPCWAVAAVRLYANWLRDARSRAIFGRARA
jgi:homoserine O-succinyltransferase/O-acetyltransferase